MQCRINEMSANVELIWNHCLRRWPNIKPTLDELQLFAVIALPGDWWTFTNKSRLSPEVWAQTLTWQTRGPLEVLLRLVLPNNTNKKAQSWGNVWDIIPTTSCAWVCWCGEILIRMDASPLNDRYVTIVLTCKHGKYHYNGNQEMWHLFTKKVKTHRAQIRDQFHFHI